MPENFARDLTDTEVCNQILVVTNQQQAFIDNNTSPLVTYEWETNLPIRRIRYGGISNGPNRFRL